MGKGRQIAALIFENFCRGRQKVGRVSGCRVHRSMPEQMRPAGKGSLHCCPSASRQVVNCGDQLPLSPGQAVWFSASGDLALDASRDFKDIGALKYDPVRIHNLRKLKIPPRSGNIADISGGSASNLDLHLSSTQNRAQDWCADPDAAHSKCGIPCTHKATL